MKRLLLLITLAFSLSFLTGCFDGVYIEDNEIAIVYENARYEGTSFIIDVYITNGFDGDEFIGYMEFDIYSEDEELYIAGAGFDIDETVLANDYIMIELEFESEFVFATATEVDNAGYDLDFVTLLYWFDE